MKKKLLIALFLVALMVCIFASCGECKHESYEVKSTTPATCVAEGKIVSACTECGEEKVESIPKITTHKLKYEEVKPTCSKAGTITETCTVSGCTYTNKKAGQPATGAHKAEIVVTTAATCETDGVRAYICSECEEPQWTPGFESKIPALGHTYERGGLMTDEQMGITYVSGSCAAEGYFARVCQDCGYDKDPITREEYATHEGTSKYPTYDEEKYYNMEQWQHEFNVFQMTVEPTCTVNGYDLYKCAYCEETTQENIVFSLGHNYNKDENAVEGTDFVIDPKPTCINPGVKAYICTVCHEPATEEKDRESVPVVDHAFDDTMADKLLYHTLADCLEPETKVFKCYMDPLCNEQKTYTYGEALGHEEVRGTASCATNGLTPYTCNRPDCDFYEEREDEYSDLTAKHILGEKLTSATCITDATYKCSQCQKPYGPYAGDPTYADGFAHGNHIFDADNPQFVDSTCDAIGYNVYSCIADENCKVTRKDYENTDMSKPDVPRAEDIVARKPHAFSDVTEDGKIYCANCTLQYRDVSTEITTGGGNLCLGCPEGTPCTCGLKVEWNGYVSPDAPEKITKFDSNNAETLFVKKDVDWEALGEMDKALVMGEGVIVLYGTAETTYTIKLYSEVDGATAVGTIDVPAGAEVVVIDLYEYATVAQITIAASTDAEVSFFSIIK